MSIYFVCKTISMIVISFSEIFICRTYICYVLTFDPAPKNAIPRWCTGRKWHIPMASNRKRSRGRIKAYNMGQREGPTVPIQTDAPEESDLWTAWQFFRLMTIKHSISKIQWAIVWALNYYLTQLSSSPRSSCQQNSRQLETRCGRESHIRQRGPSGTPTEWTPASDEQERHNVTVITVGSRNFSLCSIFSSLSHATLEQPFRTLAIKWEVNIIVKKSSCVVYSCVCLIIVSLWCCMNMYMCI